jgi:hypothetical protein
MINGNKINSEDHRAAPSAINIGNNSTRPNNTPVNAQRVNQPNNPSQSYTKSNQLPILNSAQVHSKKPQQRAPQQYTSQYRNKPPQQHVPQSQYRNKPLQQPHFQPQQQHNAVSRQGYDKHDQHHR